ncbi:carboxypeptidase-like regulatory domain-containing protein [Neolewinella antarctica]|uniref:TonB-dependent receptor n=1 Tax=Neolewinella antarctica TaxID=442734 RepID=A0ABX0X6V1_9BACT|nr:carboxypeptidase-like regulatory domain-containing protein [Neolewinella antarctica]NJC24926.1 hypothetical protein [Neolewinella antarctica]
MKRFLRPRAALLGCVLLLMACPLLAQTANFTVAGTVTEADGLPLIGVTVRLAKSNSGTVTDFDGNYRLSSANVPGTYAVIFSYLGYADERREFTVSNAGDEINLDVTLADDALNLDEIIVTGASVATSRRQLGNAISTLGSEALEETGAVSVD